LLYSRPYDLEYGYNLGGQLTSEKYPTGRIVTNTIDNFGRLSTVADASRTYLTSLALNNQGLLSQMDLGNGTNQTFGYNGRFQMLSQRLQRGTEVLQKYDYSYGTTNLATGSADNRFRTGTKPNKLGPKSLQVVTGQADQQTGSARGYADLDCSNPAQSFWQAIQHILGR
jgi:uncharacterized protein RhaS with RHS repeats